MLGIKEYLEQHPEYAEMPLGKAQDLSKRKFNKLQPLIRVQNFQVKNSNVYWLCKCDCGQYTVTNSSSLTTDHTKSCGCEQIQSAKNQVKDEVGNRYGKLTVIKKSNKKGSSRQIYWVCQCDCGGITEARGTELRAGKKLSCGCLQSKGEEKLQKILLANNINFKSQFSFSDLKDKGLLRFDFGVMDKNNTLLFLIEFQGEQHYRNTYGWFGQKRFEDLQYKDFLKQSYCTKNKIPLLIIPYTDYDILTIEYIKKHAPLVEGFDWAD